MTADRSPIHVGLSEDGLTVELCVAREVVSMAPSFADDLGGILMAVAEMAKSRAELKHLLDFPTPRSFPGDI